MIALQQRLNRVVKQKELAERRCLESVDLGRSDFAILHTILCEGALPVNTLAKKVSLTSGSATTAVDRMVKRGLVERSESKKDRRIVNVKLTRAGRSLARKASKGFDTYLDQSFEFLSENELRKLLKLLEKLDGGLERVINDSN